MKIITLIFECQKSPSQGAHLGTRECNYGAAPESKTGSRQRGCGRQRREQQECRPVPASCFPAIIILFLFSSRFSGNLYLGLQVSPSLQRNCLCDVLTCVRVHPCHLYIALHIKKTDWMSDMGITFFHQPTLVVLISWRTPQLPNTRSLAACKKD